MGALAILVLSVAAIDSLNPSTIAPAAVLALGEQPAWRVGLFTAGVFVTSTTGPPSNIRHYCPSAGPFRTQP